MKEFLKEVESNDIGKIQKDVFASKFTTYKVGGLVRAIIYPKNTDKAIIAIITISIIIPIITLNPFFCFDYKFTISILSLNTIPAIESVIVTFVIS